MKHVIACDNLTGEVVSVIRYEDNSCVVFSDTGVTFVSVGPVAGEEIKEKPTKFVFDKKEKKFKIKDEKLK